MIRFALGLVPPWGWALLAGAAIATATGWHLVQLRQARQEVRDEMSQQATRDVLRRHEANQGVTDRAHKERLTLAAAAAAARAESHRLRDELAAARAHSEAGPGADGGAAVALELLGECAARRSEVAGEAARLAAQVRGLQDYASRVCVARDR
jgi:hypothetical protein